jgi:hypothetical protein
MANRDQGHDPQFVLKQADESVVADPIAPETGQLTMEGFAKLARIVAAAIRDSIY